MPAPQQHLIWRMRHMTGLMSRCCCAMTQMAVRRAFSAVKVYVLSFLKLLFLAAMFPDLAAVCWQLCRRP